jgi:hypothetical protein
MQGVRKNALFIYLNVFSLKNHAFKAKIAHLVVVHFASGRLPVHDSFESLTRGAAGR